MKITAVLLFLFCSVFNRPTSAQMLLFEEAFESFSTTRLWEFEQIVIDWKMEGILQADLNEGFNYLLENNPSLAGL